MTIAQIEEHTGSDFIVIDRALDMKIYDTSTDSFAEFKQIKNRVVLEIEPESYSDGGSRFTYLKLFV